MKTRYYSVTLYTDIGEREISAEEVERIWQDSEAEHTGYTRDAHEIIVEVEDDPTDDWDGYQTRQCLYRVGDTWYSIPEVFQDMRLNLVDEDEEEPEFGTHARISLDNGRTFISPEEALLRGDWDTIVHYMDDDVRESVHRDLAPCRSPLAFLIEYLRRANCDLIIG